MHLEAEEDFFQYYSLPCYFKTLLLLSSSFLLGRLARARSWDLSVSTPQYSGYKRVRTRPAFVVCFGFWFGLAFLCSPGSPCPESWSLSWPGCLQTLRSTCLSLLNAGIKGVSHHAGLHALLFMWVLQSSNSDPSCLYRELLRSLMLIQGVTHWTISTASSFSCILVFVLVNWNQQTCCLSYPWVTKKKHQDQGNCWHLVGGLFTISEGESLTIMAGNVAAGGQSGLALEQ